MTYTNTSVVALNYCRKNGITTKNSTYENYTPFSPSYYSGTFDYSGKNNTLKYIILSSGMYDRYYAEPVKYAKQIQVYESIKQNDTLIKEFTSTPPIYTVDLLNWVDNLNYYVQRKFGKKLPDRIGGTTILIYKTK
jgi:hypothetical protein